LNISDTVDFTREISQEISSTPYVVLEDGLYNMTAKIKNTARFNQLKMFAQSGGVDFECKIIDENIDWKSIQIEKVVIKNGKIKIGFYADGQDNSFCLVDDVTLVKQ
jgi:hypothetical protein